MAHNGRPCTAHPQNYDNRPENDGPFILTHDGKEIMRGTRKECFTFLRRCQNFITSYALTYAGYTIKRA